MNIRETTDPDHIDALVEIVASHIDDRDDLGQVREQLTRELKQAGHHRHFYVGTEDGAIVAMIQLVLDHADNNPVLADGADVVHVHNLQVRSDFQRKGLGRQMMDFVEDKARELGKMVITLGVDDTNKRAMIMYKKRGYETFAIEPGRTPDEKCYLMKKSLR
jgi:ribosomal protein S18 acetylase RimI-like enzyme